MSKLLFLVAVMVCLSSCVPLKIQAIKNNGIGGQKSNLQTINDGEIKLIIRDYITPGVKEYPYYKYYSYLVFNNKSSSTLKKRKAASEAYMCQFSNREDAEKIQLNLEDLAVFYVPLKSRFAAIALRNSTSAVGLLSNYNYTYAQALLSSIGDIADVQNFSIGIIASPNPLGLESEYIPTEHIEILNLSDFPPAQIGNVIRKFRKTVTGRYDRKVVDIVLDVDPVTGTPLKTEKRVIPVLNEVSTIDMATKFRMVFSSVGKLFMFGEAYAEETQDCI